MDGTNRADKANGTRGENGDGKIACKPFSKVLIVRAIGRASPDPSEGATLYTHLFNIIKH